MNDVHRQNVETSQDGLCLVGPTLIGGRDFDFLQNGTSGFGLLRATHIGAGKGPGGMLPNVLNAHVKGRIDKGFGRAKQSRRDSHDRSGIGPIAIARQFAFPLTTVLLES